MGVDEEMREKSADRLGVSQGGSTTDKSHVPLSTAIFARNKCCEFWRGGGKPLIHLTMIISCFNSKRGVFCLSNSYYGPGVKR